MQVLTTVLLLWCTPQSAWAYLDPGTGSLLVQGAIAAIAAGAFTVKTYWYRIIAFFRGETPEPPDEVDEPASGSDDP
jgi:hypothetical protein